MKKALVFVGLAGLGYFTYRVWNLATALKESYPDSKINPWVDAARSQANYGLIGAGALLAAYTVAR